MKDKDYVSLEVAKLMQDKGYREPSRGVYQKIFTNREEVLSRFVEEWEYDKYSKDIIAPSLYDAQKWLREKSIFIDINTDFYDWFFFNYKIFTINKHCETIIKEGNSYNTYEEALNEGIKEALKYI